MLRNTHMHCSLAGNGKEKPALGRAEGVRDRKFRGGIISLLRQKERIAL